MRFAKFSHKLDLSHSLAEEQAMVQLYDEGLVVPVGAALRRCSPTTNQVRWSGGAAYLGVQP
jgi:hypothetical protein